MANYNIPEYRVSVDQLRKGVFIRLENLSWFSHPFLLHSFKIRKDEQIEVLRQLGVKKVICVPEKSDVLPLKPKEAESLPVPPPSPAAREGLDELWRLKRERGAVLREKKERVARCEEHYGNTLSEVASVMEGIHSCSPEAVRKAMELADRMADLFLSDAESSLHLLNVMDTADNLYYHSLNVAVLSLMIGQAADLSREEMRTLVLSALFHDIGKVRIEKKLLYKKGTLSKPEQEIVRGHPAHGVEMLRKAADFPEPVLDAVLHHHEAFDGTGYPEGRSGSDIGIPARILAIADAYDNLCNQRNPVDSYTPYQALSCMFAQEKRRFDPELLALFIRSLGVYPPGTVVQLDSGAIGMVISVSPENQLKPSIVIYDSEIPKKEALVIDMSTDQDLKIEKSIRPAHLPPEIFDYLSPRTRITYFVSPDSEQSK